jgi:two-component system chemotaxis response regulator CheY
MVIDDSRAMRTILGSMMRGLGFEVVEACDGRDALTRLQTEAPPAVALLDWNMPDLNGFDVLRLLRANRALDGMRIVMVTTETEMAQVARTLEAGADEYVMKPFTRDIIQAKLELLGLIPESAEAHP